MKKWLLLTGAIFTEVAGTLTLRATVEHPSLVPLVVVAYATSFFLIGLTLREGMKIGVVYGIWGAFGVALVAVLGMIIFDEVLSVGDFIGIALIIAGVVLVETGSSQPPRDTAHRVSV